MSEECVRDELRTLFLFEKLSDEQLDILCEAGKHRDVPGGSVGRRG